MEINRFISRDVRRLRIYMEMIHQIHEKIPVTQTDIETWSEQVLTKWEKSQSHEIRSLLFDGKPHQNRTKEEIIGRYREALREWVKNDQHYHECIGAVKTAFDQIFQ